MFALVMNPGLAEEQQFMLRPGTVTVGRTRDNAVFCLHKSLSRKHAQIDFDGVTVKITDLQSKNGVFFNGRRVTHCELGEGDSFRCGDITFLIESRAARPPSPSGALAHEGPAQTLPSPFALDSSISRRPTAQADAYVTVEDEQRYKDKLFLLIRASELCVGEMSIDKILDELIALAVQVLDVDRIALLTLDDVTLEMRPRVIKTFVAHREHPYSQRVVDWVVDHGSPASFADVSRDRTLPGNLMQDENVRGAMCVPINPGGGTVGVIYADSLSHADCFRPDDLALLRALANLAAIATESAALRNVERQTALLR